MKNLKTNLNTLYPPSPTLKQNTYIASLDQYLKMYNASIEDPVEFWKKLSEQFFWKKQSTGPFLDYNFDLKKGDIFIRWMEGAITNVCYNLVDRHVEEGHGDKIAYYWKEMTQANKKKSPTKHCFKPCVNVPMF